MSESEKVNAILGTANGGSANNEDWKSKYEAILKQVEWAKAQEGRAKKAEADKHALEKELAELRQSKEAERLAGALTDQERENLSPEFVGAAAKIAAQAANGAMSEVNSELERIRQEREEEKEETRKRAESGFFDGLNAKYPGFVENVSEGGKWRKSWERFLQNNSDSVRHAMSSLDIKSLSYHVDRFYREELEIVRTDKDRDNASAPDPVPNSGGTTIFVSNPDKTYTSEEYAALEERAMKLRRQGRFDEYKKIDDELATILAEGRVKD